MTTWRKRVLGLGCFAIAALFVFPPWGWNPRGDSRSIPLGHAPIFRHPNPFEASVSSVRIDWNLLLAECGAVVFLVGGALLVLPGARRKDANGERGGPQ